MTEQCKLLGINRASYNYQCRQDQEDRDVSDLQLILEVMRELLEMASGRYPGNLSVSIHT